MKRSARRRTPDKASVLPVRTSATTRSQIIQFALVGRFEELRRLIGIDALDRRELSELELKAIASRMDNAIAGVTDVSTRDRALVWLHDAVEEVGRSMGGDFVNSGAAITIPLRMWARFYLGQVEQFPMMQGGREQALPGGERARTKNFRTLGPALVAAARAAMRQGRRRGGAKPIPQKWLALRDLAVAEGLIAAMEPHDFRRVVLDARARLARFEQALKKG
jgi:hypothetical protein